MYQVNRPSAGSWRSAGNELRDREAHSSRQRNRFQSVEHAARALFVTVTLVALATSCGDAPTAPTDVNNPQGGGAGGGIVGPPPVVGIVPSVENPPITSLAAAGDAVGVFELAAPDVSPFVFHATLPVPRGTFVPATGDVPFKLVDEDGRVTPTQVETVTRYPRGTDGADVVEILARVERPTRAHAGDRIVYTAIYDRHAAGACAPDASVNTLLATPDALVLRTHDVFDHEYKTDLYADARTSSGSARILKRGRTEVQVATHEVLKPVEVVAGDQGTLPHMMGVHSYVTRYTGESFVALDLRVHNGFSGLDATTTDDDPIGKVYFRELELVVPAGWVVFGSQDDPFLGEPYDEAGSRVYPIVAPIDAGPNTPMHMMPSMAQFHRRLVVAHVGAEANAQASLFEQGLGFSRAGTANNGHEYFSWWNPITGRWFSQRQALPSLAPTTDQALRDSLSAAYATQRTQVATGSTGLFPIESGNLGWAHPWGINQGGMVSGSEIYLYDGVDVACGASTDGYRLHQLTHRMYSDRQPNVLFNADGHHTSVAQWTVHTQNGDYLPIWWYNTPMFWASDPFGYTHAPTFQVDAVAASGRKPFYEDELSSYESCDFQHLIRYTRSAKVLVWLGNDAIAKDDLVAQAEGFHLSYSTLPQDLWGNIIPTGLLAMQNYTNLYPHNGLPFGRGESWGLDAALVAYSIEGDAWRQAQKPWFDAILDVLVKGQTGCSNVIQATPQYNVFGSQYRCRQSIEAAIMENMLVGMRETVWLGVDTTRTETLDALLRRAFYSMIGPLVWSNVFHGPWAMMAVGPFDLAVSPYCSYVPSDGNYGFADHYQIWSSFAYAWQITHDQVFLDKAAEALGASDLTATLTSNPLENWQNKAALLALVQRLQSSHP